MEFLPMSLFAFLGALELLIQDLMEELLLTLGGAHELALISIHVLTVCYLAIWCWGG